MVGDILVFHTSDHAFVRDRINGDSLLRQAVEQLAPAPRLAAVETKGKPPFGGEVDQAVIYSIANEQHEPLTAVRTGVPKDLERIVDKCLAKEAEERYQDVTDLLVDLQSVLRGLEPQAQEPPPSQTRSKPVAPAVIGLAAAALLGAVSLAWWLTRSSEPPTQYKYTQITFDTGHTPEPALSPDGKLLAYASDRVGFQSDIYVQALSGGKSIPLTNHEAEDYRPSFSPDGSHIVFVSDRDGGGIFVVPALGGNPRRVADKGDRPRYSPDGEWISYSQEEPDRANLWELSSKLAKTH